MIMGAELDVCYKTHAHLRFDLLNLRQVAIMRFGRTSIASALQNLLVT